MKDPFSRLGLPRTYSIDLRELEDNHKRLSLELHPDRLRGRLPRERREALSLAMEVNQAYRTLKDPAERARALGALLGLDVPDEESRAIDQGFLMEMMELQEALLECEARRDAPRVSAIIDKARSESASVQDALGRAFAADPPRVAEIAELVGKLRYYARVLEQAELIDDHLAGDERAAGHL